MSAATLSSEYVTDIMGLVLRIEKRRLSPLARVIFDAAENGSVLIHIPSMVFAEILYLSEKGRISIALQDVADYLKKHPNFRETPITLEAIQAAAEITDIPELHDRLIAGTTKLLDLELITNDSIIQASAHVRTVW